MQEQSKDTEPEANYHSATMAQESLLGLISDKDRACSSTTFHSK